MVKVFEYADFRQFLKDFCDDKKKQNKRYSYRILSQKAGIASPNFYQQVIIGKRNLTKATVFKTCKALKLKDKESAFFENLVFFNQAKKGEEKDQYFTKIIASQRSTTYKVIDPKHYEYFQAWWHSIIRELVTIGNFKDDYAILGHKLKPRLNASQAKHSVQLLLKLGFIKKEKGGYVHADPVIKTHNPISDYSVLRYHFTMLKLFIKHYEDRNTDERMSSTTTFGISEATFQAMKEKIRTFRAELQEMARDDQAPEKVYQMNMNLISLSN